MSSFVIRDVRIFTGDEEIPSGSVIVENGKITQVSDTQLDPPGSSSSVISKPGCTLLPGLIDAHIHADKANPVALPQSLRFGVTTVCDMHNETWNVTKLRQQAKEDPNAADFKTCGPSATIENGWPIPVVTAHDKSEETAAAIVQWPQLKDPSDAAAYIRARVAENVDYIKLMHESGRALGFQFAQPTLELQSAVIREAHAHGLVAVAHATCLADTLAILSAGVDGLTHTFCDAAPTPELVQAYRANNAYCNPTLVAMGSLTTEGQAMQEGYARDERVAGLLGEAERERLCACMGMARREGNSVEYAYESVRVLKGAGIDVVCGSDAAGPALGTSWGLSVHHELALFVNKCGFTPAEALRSATVLPAKRLGFPDRGRIREGLKADLVLVEGNPLQDIDHTLDLRAVWRDGVLCSTYKEKL